MRFSHAATVAVALGAAGCRGERREPASGRSDEAATSVAADSRALPMQLRGIGRVATDTEIRAWNIDVNPSGAGLPVGSGTYERGAVVFAKSCASCHGPRGEGSGANPKLVGREPRDFSFATDFKLPKTIGNYWPYATTLYDYINRAMPFATPGSLPPDDVYSVIAFLLVENGIIDRGTAVDATTLPKVRMPARDHFVADDRQGGRAFK